MNYDDKQTYDIYCKLKTKLYKQNNKIIKWMPKGTKAQMSYEDFIKHCLYTHSNVQYRSGIERIK